MDLPDQPEISLSRQRGLFCRPLFAFISNGFILRMGECLILSSQALCKQK